MELQACEMADQIHPYIKSFGNHNTTIATSVTAELAKYNIWFKKYFNAQNKTSSNKSYSNITTSDRELWFEKNEAELLRDYCYSKNNPQNLSIIETALCYGLTLNYEAINSEKNALNESKRTDPEWAVDNARKEFLDKIRKLNTICRFKILDTAIYSLYETDVLTDDRLSVFSVSNISDHITELLALDVLPSPSFNNVLSEITNMARNNEVPVFKIIEQFAYLPHTLENDLLYNLGKSEKEELEPKITAIREKYAENSQNVTDATVFRTADDSDEEAYDFEASQASSVDKMNMYG